jgi:hypothetical protein
LVRPFCIQIEPSPSTKPATYAAKLSATWTGGQKCGNVLDEDGSGIKIANGSSKLRPEPSVIVLSSTFPSDGNGLAREAAGEEVDGREATRAPLPRTIASVRLTPGCALLPGRFRFPLFAPSPSVGVGHMSTDSVDLVDISISGNIWPVLGEDSLAEGVPLDLEAAVPSGSLEAEVDAADACEEAAERRAVFEFPKRTASVRLTP